MSNLIERLRDFCEDHIEDYRVNLDYDDVQPIVTEAAQALVEKDIELERLEGEVKQMGRMWGEEVSRNDRLQAELKQANAVVEAAKNFINNHMDHDDSMVLHKALAALDNDEQAEAQG